MDECWLPIAFYKELGETSLLDSGVVVSGVSRVNAKEDELLLAYIDHTVAQ